MFIGSLGLWIATPLLWLWVGSQVQGATGSLGAAFGAALVGAVLTVVLLASVLASLSNTYRANRSSRGLADTGHAVLERVLIASAGFAVVVFAIWFLFFAGTTPLPLGIGI
jgi:hypothetical protein